jgi:hypothetical protein
MPGVKSTILMDQIKLHYYASHPDLNKFSIVPRGLNFEQLLQAPHNRAANFPVLSDTTAATTTTSTTMTTSTSNIIEQEESSSSFSSIGMDLESISAVEVKQRSRSSSPKATVLIG